MRTDVVQSRNGTTSSPHTALLRLALIAALSLWIAPPARAQEPQKPATPSTEKERQAEIERLRKELESVRKSPDAPAEWKEIVSIEDKLMRANNEKAKEERPLRDRMQKLNQSPAATEWHEKVNAVTKQLGNQYDAMYAGRLGIARQLFEARQKELAKIAPADVPQARGLGLDPLTYPRVDGSTSAHPLCVLIASRCLGAPYAWVGRSPSAGFAPRGWGGYNDDFPYSRSFREPEFSLVEYTMQAKMDEKAPERLPIIINRMLTVNASTHDAYVNLIEGRSDVGLIARRPSPDELKLAGEKGVELETVPFALDAFVFLVNDEHPVKDLTTAQIRDIYLGKVINWKDVGGPDQKISPYQREPNSGSQELMVELVMKDLPFAQGNGNPSGRPLIGYSMMGPFLALTQDKNGLAYSVYYYEHFMSGSPKTRVIAVDGVEPTAETIRDRKYPYVSEVFVATRKGLDPSSPTAKWRAWLLSPEGQSIVAESGYVPISAAAKGAETKPAQ